MGILKEAFFVIAKKAGLKVIGAGSFIGEHSFSTDETPVAKSRPDNEDLKKTEEFGRDIIKKVENIIRPNDISSRIPYGGIPLIGEFLTLIIQG